MIHGMHDEQDMRRMGKLFVFMPVTAVTFIIGWLAIAGCAAVRRVLVEGRDAAVRPRRQRAAVVGLLGAILGVLLTRQVIMVFFGEAHWKDHADERTRRDQAARGPWMMLFPLVVLAVLASSAASSSCRSPMTCTASSTGSSR